MKINLATNLHIRLVTFIKENRNSLYVPQHLTIEQLLCDDDIFSNWLSIHWSIIKDCDMLVVRDFMTWSYLIDTQASSSINLEYYFNESI